jgi:hypothetical protein
MDGEKIRTRATVLDENGQSILVGPPWRAGRFVAKRDLAWHNSSTNETQIWIMDGDQIRSRVTALDEKGKPILVGPPWAIVGVGDLDGDGRSDIVWHNSSTNETQIWIMDGDRIRSRVTALDEKGKPILVGPPWSIVGVGT